MFTLFKRNIPKPSAAVLEQEPVTTIDRAAYLDLAKKVGWTSGQRVVELEESKIARNEFRHYLAENGLPVYAEAAVMKYMDKITPRGYVWEWVSLQNYSKPIPEAVLMTIARIQETYPHAYFDVTDIVESPPQSKDDPFLRVSLSDTSRREWRSGGVDTVRSKRVGVADGCFIIERWDEPTFRQ